MKKIISIILAAILSISLVACGGGSSSDIDTQKNNSTGEIDIDYNIVVREERTEADEDWYAYKIVEYNEVDSAIKITYYNKDDSINRTSVNEYDENGNLIKGSFYNGDGTLATVSLFDPSIGPMVRTELWDYGSDGVLKCYFKYTYDENGSLIKTETYDANDTLIETKEN